MRSVAAASARETRADGSYQLDHSATLYLLDSRGRLAAVFSPPLAAATLTGDLRALGHAGVFGGADVRLVVGQAQVLRPILG